MTDRSTVGALVTVTDGSTLDVSVDDEEPPHPATMSVTARAIFDRSISPPGNVENGSHYHVPDAKMQPDLG
jgi:hypothetical protein